MGTGKPAIALGELAADQDRLYIAPTCTGADAIEAVQIAITEAERVGGRPLSSLLPVNPPPARSGGSSWSPTTAARSF